MAVGDVSSDAPLSVDELLARSKAAAAAKAAGQSTGGSKIQQMLAGTPDPADTVELSAVAKQLKSNAAAKPSSTPYTEQDWYLKAKVAQLKAQIEIFSKLPGLDPSGGVMDSLTQEVNDLVRKQQVKLKASQAEAAAKQKELDEKTKANDLAKAIPSADLLLKRAKAAVNGEKLEPFRPETAATNKEDAAKKAAVEAMLKKAKESAARGGSVNTSA